MTVLASCLAAGVRAVHQPFERIPEAEKCDGSGRLVRDETLDGNFVGTCGDCDRYVIAEELVGCLRRVRDHRPLRVVTFTGVGS